MAEENKALIESLKSWVNAYQLAKLSLDKMVKQGRLKAYHINRHGRSISLFPVERLDERTSFVVEDTKSSARYVFDMHSEGGIICNDGDSQTVHYSLTLRRLPKNFRTKMLNKKDCYGRVLLEDRFVEAELRLTHEDDWESAGDVDVVAGSGGSQEVEKGQDKLFDELLADIRKYQSA